MENLSEKYLIFSLNDEYYGLPITKVREVIRQTNITRLHEVNSFLKGVINLRGKIIPVIDMRLKFGMQEKEYNDRTIFIIVEVLGKYETFFLGIAVDAVSEVVEIDKGKMEKAPQIGLSLKTHYLYGISQVGDTMIMILNIDKILTTEEVVDLKMNNTLSTSSYQEENALINENN